MKARPPDTSQPRVLLELGRQELATFLEVLSEHAAAGNIPIPDPGLADELYFDRAGTVLQEIGLRLWAAAPTWELRETSDTSDTAATTKHSTAARHRSLYVLRRGLGVWKLTFEGREADLKHEKGILYVAYLLIYSPRHPIHALDLFARIRDIRKDQAALAQMVDPSTGKAAALSRDTRIQERALGLDDIETLRALRSKERELEAILADDDESEPVKQEAFRELEAIVEFQRKHSRRTEDSAQRAVRAVRRAIVRFHRNLAAALDLNGNPHPILQPFAAHLEKHLLIPSARYSGPTIRARGSQAGCFTYDPPPNVIWRD